MNQQVTQEDALIAKILQVLTTRSVFAWRQSNAGKLHTPTAAKNIADVITDAAIRNPTALKNNDLVTALIQTALHKSWRKVAGVRRGIPDIEGFCLATGRAIFVEVKIGNDKLSDDQKSFLNTAQESGCICIVAKNIQGFLNDFERKMKQKNKCLC